MNNDAEFNLSIKFCWGNTQGECPGEDPPSSVGQGEVRYKDLPHTNLKNFKKKFQKKILRPKIIFLKKICIWILFDIPLHRGTSYYQKLAQPGKNIGLNWLTGLAHLGVVFTNSKEVLILATKFLDIKYSSLPR